VIIVMCDHGLTVIIETVIIVMCNCIHAITNVIETVIIVMCDCGLQKRTEITMQDCAIQTLSP